MNSKQLAGWSFAGVGLLAIVVACYFDYKVSAMAAEMEYGLQVVTQKYQIRRTQGNGHDYRVEVSLETDNQTSRNPSRQSPRNLLVDVSKSDFNTLTEGSPVALVWQRSDPSNNLAGTEVLPLVNGEMTESAFVKQQTQKVTFAIYCSVASLALGILMLVFTRRK